MIDDMFSEMKDIKDLDLNEILNNLIDGSKDVDLKTQILKPKQLASLKVLSEFLGKLNYVKSKDTIERFLEIYFRYMFSYNRQSRKEVIQAISAQFEKKSESLMYKLTGKLP